MCTELHQNIFQRIIYIIIVTKINSEIYIVDFLTVSYLQNTQSHLATP